MWFIAPVLDSCFWHTSHHISSFLRYDFISRYPILVSIQNENDEVVKCFPADIFIIIQIPEYHSKFSCSLDNWVWDTLLE